MAARKAKSKRKAPSVTGVLNLVTGCLAIDKRRGEGWPATFRRAGFDDEDRVRIVRIGAAK